MKKLIIIGMALCLGILSACSASETTPKSDATPAPDPTTEASDPTPTPSSNGDITSDISELLSEYYTSEEISNVSSTTSTLEVKVLYPGAADSQPEDWDTVCENAISASSILYDNLSEDPYQNLVVQALDEGGNIILTVANGKVRYSKFSTYDSSENPSTITLEEFNAIQNGMSYDEVFEIIGGRGEVLSETDLGLGDEYISIMFSWEGEGSLGANATVLFQGGKVSSKAQFGLE